METLIGIIILIVVIAALVSWLVCARVRKFRENIKPGDSCHVFIGEERWSARVMYITEQGRVFIEFPFGFHEFGIDNIYP